MANIELDGANKKIKVDSGDLTLDVPGDIVLDADGGDVVVADGGTNILKVTNSSSDVVLQPQVDAKDIIFKQYDGTTVATVEDNGTFNVPANKLAIGGTAVTSTAAELNILDGVTSTAAELNILDGVTSTAAELNILDGVTATASELNLLDGGTSVGSSITLADADGIVVNDGGTMKTIPASDVKTYAGGAGLNLTASLTVTSNTSTADLNGCFNTTYDNYLVVFDYTPSENGVNPKIRFKDTSNNALTGSNYTYAFHGNDQFGNEENSVAHDDSSIQPGQGTFNNTNIDYPAIAGALYFNSPMNSNHQTEVTGNTTQFGNNGDNRTYSVGIRFEAQTQVAGLQFFFASGNVNNLTCRVYGLTNS